MRMPINRSIALWMLVPTFSANSLVASNMCQHLHVVSVKYNQLNCMETRTKLVPSFEIQRITELHNNDLLILNEKIQTNLQQRIESDVVCFLLDSTTHACLTSYQTGSATLSCSPCQTRAPTAAEAPQ